MASSHSSPPPKKPCVPPPNWLDLPADVTASILRRLDDVEILTSAQHVCSTWRRICRDPSMWRSISMGDPGGNRSLARNLPELCRHAVDLSSGGLLNINLKFFSSSGLLGYIADRSKHLRRLRLMGCVGISKLELIEVAGKLPLLEELALSYCRCPIEVVAAFGRLCPLLNSFQLNAFGWAHSADDGEALAIAENMSSLCHLQIFGNKLTNVGLIVILDGCQQLESLDLRRCCQVKLDADLKRRCTQRIKHFRGPNGFTYGFVVRSEFDQCVFRMNNSNLPCFCRV